MSDELSAPVFYWHDIIGNITIYILYIRIYIARLHPVAYNTIYSMTFED